ncbi:MAG TPA: hypothetical protein VHG08_17305, partial [Longimicrobium sp.]|nr:hypothetical protein [Longimicrobium sp.]
PATSISGEGQSLGLASTQWTLGPGGGVQTLRARAGTLETTFTVNVIPPGTRNLMAQVPGRVLDAMPDRVLWLDSAGTQRLVKIRTLSTGTDAVVKVDTPQSPTRSVMGRLFTGGALVWPQVRQADTTDNPLFEYRNGTLALLAHTYVGAGIEGDWAAWGTGSAIIRRDLAAGANATIVNANGVGDPGADGDVVYRLDDGTTGLYQNGTHTPLTFDGFNTSSISVQTDGVNVVWLTFPPTLNTTQLYLDRPANDLLLATGEALYFGINGGWIAWNTGIGPVMRRSPGGTVQQVSTTTTGNRLHAVGTDGSLVYQHPAPNGRYFLVSPDGSVADVGVAASGDRIAWRVDRFLLINGGSVYVLAT